ncbi:MAG TPA: exodeoxyribonuclease VII large subunit [Marinilabiliaceae bacterium]|nr:exodeoxyribonuclease VII large subunit [Marinilabiliaceae bacterium]
MSKKALSLFELNQQIKGALKESFPSSIWVRAEIAELRENRNGHCYLDLIEKDEETNQVVARMRAMIWSYTYRMLKPFFETTTGQPFTEGIKVLIQGSVEFQELFGMSFTIQDIDPAYTLGDLEQKRLEVIRKFESEGVLKMNKELSLPLVPQKIAIISSPTAAGYGDFIHQLESNAYSLKFYHKLFPAIMQGEKAPGSIADAFDKIFEYAHFFDVVVLIRGGGASVDLLCFDDYWLCYNITQFPIPVLTGIGHERDLSVADIVAHTNLKTPTAVAEFLINGAGEALNIFNGIALNLKNIVKEKLNKHHQKVDRFSMQIKPLTQQLLTLKKHYLMVRTERVSNRTYSIIKREYQQLDQWARLAKQLPTNLVKNQKKELVNLQNKAVLQTQNIIKDQKKRVDLLAKENQLNDPINILNKGFTLTYLDDHPIKDSVNLTNDMEITTHFRDGIIKSKITKK